MSENPPEKRDYDREYANWKKKKGNMDRQYARVKARREMIKEYGKERLAGKDIDHVRPLRNDFSAKPGGGKSNWKISSPKANRDWRKGKKGYD